MGSLGPSAANPLFEPVTVGAWQLAHRIVYGISCSRLKSAVDVIKRDFSRVWERIRCSARAPHTEAWPVELALCLLCLALLKLFKTCPAHRALVRLGYTKLRCRAAPLTRSRAIDNTPQPAAATYYGQRATDGGLMISEATVVSAEGRGYNHTPGIFSQEQIEAWKPVVDSVHSKGATFLLQLWHCGRASHQGVLQALAPSLARLSHALCNGKHCKGCCSGCA